MFVWSLLSIIGIAIADRTLHQIENLRIFSKRSEKYLRSMCFLAVILLNFVSRKHVFSLVGVNAVIILSPLIIPVIIESYRHKKIKDNLILIIDNLVLSMRSGKSFRVSLQHLVDHSDIYIKITLNELINALKYQKETKFLSNESEIQCFLAELALIDKTAHKPIEMLVALRRKLQMIKNFRQKSRQAMMQTRAQSLVTTGIFILVTIYVQFQFGLSNHKQLVTFSVIFFSLGFYFTFNMGRRYKWKI